jgi:hypothetical protein
MSVAPGSADASVTGAAAAKPSSDEGLSLLDFPGGVPRPTMLNFLYFIG